MQSNNTPNFNISIGKTPKILVVADSVPKAAYDRGDTMAKPAYEMFIKVAESNGFIEEDFIFITPCPPIPIEFDGSDSKVGKFVSEYHDEFISIVKKHLRKVKMVVTLGKVGCRQLAGKAVQITKARGTFSSFQTTGNLPTLPLLSPFHVLRRPELADTYNTDFRQLKNLRDVNWDVDEYVRGCGTDKYQWSKDLSDLIKNPPALISLDCETIGLDWHSKDFTILTVTLTPKKGVSYVVPVNVQYATNKDLHGVHTPEWMKCLTEKDVQKSVAQIKRLLQNPNICVIGHNLKFDIHSLRTIGVRVANWYLDTMQMAFAIDENMTSKSLDDCVRRWLPTHSGYADDFNKSTDKSRMDLVKHDDMLNYAGGDTDVVYRLCAEMLPMVKNDSQNAKTFFKIQMPSLRTFVAMEEVGVRIDTEALLKLEEALNVREKELYDELISMAPAKVLREFEGNWNFGSQKFLVACLFGPNGITDPSTGKRLKPTVFTSSTAKLPDDQKVPSTSAKDHLPYFEHIPFVRLLMQYSKVQKVRSTYVGTPSRKTSLKIKPLKNGGLPKAYTDILKSGGIEIPKSKNTRRRKKIFDQPQFVKSGGKTLHVDVCGNVISEVESEATGFWQYLNKQNDTIHTSFLLHATNTGRSSSRSPNLQNTPKRGDMAKEFRRIFLPPIEGWKFLELDYSQVELRIAAWMANESSMIRIYLDGGDIHSATAAAVIGIPLPKFMVGRKDDTLLKNVINDWPGARNYLSTLQPKEREKFTVKQYCDLKRYQAKAVNFGYLYGMWWRKFKVYAKTDYGIDYTDEEAEQTRISFFKKYPLLERWHKIMKSRATNNGYVRALHGAIRRLPNVESFDDSIIQGSERQAVNAPVQRFASDLGLIAINRVFRDAPPEMIKPVLFIHDAIVPCVHPDYVEEAASAIKYYMENPPLTSWFSLTCPFPLVADVSVGSNLGEMEELNVSAKKPKWYQSGQQCKSNSKYNVDEFEHLKKRGVILTD